MYTIGEYGGCEEYPRNIVFIIAFTLINQSQVYIYIFYVISALGSENGLDFIIFLKTRIYLYLSHTLVLDIEFVKLSLFLYIGCNRTYNRNNRKCSYRHIRFRLRDTTNFSLDFVLSNYLYRRYWRRWPPCVLRQACRRLVINPVTLSMVPDVCRICWEAYSTSSIGLVFMKIRYVS